MRKLLENFLTYSNRQRNGFVVFISTCLLAFLIPYFFASRSTIKHTDFTTFKKEIQNFEEARLAAAAVTPIISKNTFQEKKYFETSPSRPKLKLTNFDPNKASVDAMVAMGLDKRIVKNIEKYRSSNGVFKKPEDLKKIYGLNDALYNKISPFLVFEKSNNSFSEKQDSKPAFEKAVVPIEMFQFDPNDVTREEMQRLGMSEIVINTILKYRKKGGSYRKVADFDKIFHMTEEERNRIRPFVQIKASNEAKAKKVYENKYPKKKALPLASIDVNKADIIDLMKIPGVGKYYGQRILERREALGGFYSIEQVSETYSLPDSTFQLIKPFLKCDPAEIKKIPLNSGDAKMIKHPYIEWKIANLIVKYRKQHNEYKAVSDIKNIKILKEESYLKLEPYLSLD